MVHMRGVRRGAAAIAAICAIGVACATGYDPFKVPAERLREGVDTVALRPLAVHPDLVDPQRLRALIEPRAVAMLSEGGFEVVPPEEWERRWLATAREVGEIWNPISGARDDARYDAVMSAVRHDLAVERGVDAVVELHLFAEKVEASGWSPRLCGVQREVYWPGREFPLGSRVTLAYGLCVGVRVHDLDEREIYSIRHGLEFVDTYALQTNARLPLDQRLRDPERIEEALDVILGPLATRGRR